MKWNLYVNVYSGFIHNHQKLETPQMSFNWRMDKQASVSQNITYQWRGMNILLIQEKHGWISNASCWEKIGIRWSHTVWLPFMTFSWRKIRGRESRSVGVRGWGWVEGIEYKGSWGNFWRVLEMISLYILTVVMVSALYICQNFQNCTL